MNLKWKIEKKILHFRHFYFCFKNGGKVNYRTRTKNKSQIINYFSKMGDSDDEYDRKRRDKFRGERGGDREGERERWPERER